MASDAEKSDWVRRVLGVALPDKEERAPSHVSARSDAGPDGQRYAALFAQLEGDYLTAVRIDAGDDQNVADQIAALRFTWSRATGAAEAGQFSAAADALQQLADDDRLRNLLQIRRAAVGKPKPGKLVGQRKFMLTRWARIPSELQAELARLRDALEKDGADDDPQTLIAAINDRLQVLLDDLRSQMNSGITAGNMDVFKGLRKRVEVDSLIGLLIRSPVADGSRFKQVVLSAMDEIEQALGA